MSLAAAQVARPRMKYVDEPFKMLVIGIASASVLTMTLATAVGVLDGRAVFWVPLGGMVVGNATNISVLAVDKLVTQIKDRRAEIEAYLALGATPREAIRKIIPASIRLGLTPIMINFKGIGLISIPGLMSGMILAGENPATAALFQVLIYFLLIFAGIVASLIITELAWKKLFNEDEQLIIM